MKALITTIATALCAVLYSQDIQIRKPHVISDTLEVNTHLEGDLRIPNYKHLNIPIGENYKRLDTSYAIIVYVVEWEGVLLYLKADYGMVIDTLIREDWLPEPGSGVTMNAVPYADIKPSTLIGTPIYKQYKIIAGGKPVALDMVVAIIPKQKPKNK